MFHNQNVNSAASSLTYISFSLNVHICTFLSLFMALLFLENAPFVLGVNSADYAEEYFQTDQL